MALSQKTARQAAWQDIAQAFYLQDVKLAEYPDCSLCRKIRGAVGELQIKTPKFFYRYEQRHHPAESFQRADWSAENSWPCVCETLGWQTWVMPHHRWLRTPTAYLNSTFRIHGYCVGLVEQWAMREAIHHGDNAKYSLKCLFTALGTSTAESSGYFRDSKLITGERWKPYPVTALIQGLLKDIEPPSSNSVLWKFIPVRSTQEILDLRPRRGLGSLSTDLWHMILPHLSLRTALACTRVNTNIRMQIQPRQSFFLDALIYELGSSWLPEISRVHFIMYEGKFMDWYALLQILLRPIDLASKELMAKIDRETVKYSYSDSFGLQQRDGIFRTWLNRPENAVIFQGLWNRKLLWQVFTSQADDIVEEILRSTFGKSRLEIDESWTLVQERALKKRKCLS